MLAVGKSVAIPVAVSPVSVARSFDIEPRYDAADERTFCDIEPFERTADGPCPRNAGADHEDGCFRRVRKQRGVGDAENGGAVDDDEIKCLQA